jgi:hypothetical protein
MSIGTKPRKRASDPALVSRHVAGIMAADLLSWPWRLTIKKLLD